MFKLLMIFIFLNSVSVESLGLTFASIVFLILNPILLEYALLG